MTEITIEKYARKMNRAGYDAFLQAMRHARGEQNRQVEVVHWLFHALSNQNADIAVTLRESGIDRGAVLKSLDQAMARLQKNITETTGISDRLADLLNHGWTYATLFFGEVQIRTGHMLLAALNDTHLKCEVLAAAPQLATLSPEVLGKESRRLWASSEEEAMRPMDGSIPPAPGWRSVRPPSPPASPICASRLPRWKPRSRASFRNAIWARRTRTAAPRPRRKRRN
nr:Clp protease N-terminal domain-containing protein [Rhodobacter viridis]